MGVGGAGQLMLGFTQLAQALSGAPDEDARLQTAVDSAVALVRGCDHAGVTINQEGELLTRVSSDDLVRRADELQQELGEGPCLDVMRDQDMLLSRDLTHERRWPRWAPHVHGELGVGSMMSMLVRTDERPFGALSLYAGRGHSFDLDDVAVGQAVAGHLAAVMSPGRPVDHMGLAVTSRVTAAQAQGLLMERLDVDQDAALDYLRRVSSYTNRTLVDIAGEIVRTRQLPNLEAAVLWPPERPRA